jgi:hypothetical protein
MDTRSFMNERFPQGSGSRMKKIPIMDSVGTILAHDITEIRPGDFKGRAFRRGHVIREEDLCHMQRLGKEHLFILDVGPDEMHEDEAAHALAGALMGEGVRIEGEPKEGKIQILAGRNGLLKIDKDALLAFNMLGDVMCASLHDNTVVEEGRQVAGTRAIPLIVKREIVEAAAGIGRKSGGIVRVVEMRRPKAGVVITGNEVYYGRVKDAFAAIIEEKTAAVGGTIVGICYAPDDEGVIEQRLKELREAGADLLITTGGMSVDPDDVTRFAIRNLGATDVTYGSAVLPGAMLLVAYLEGDPPIPVLGIPACGLYAKTTVFDLVLPRVLAGERIGRRELAELGHGGLCMKCDSCNYPVCPLGK